MEIKESLTLVAERRPPGDNWQLTLLDPTTFELDPIYESLTDALNAYHIKTNGRHKVYRLEPMNGKVYAIEERQVEKEVKRYNIYGDPI